MVPGAWYVDSDLVAPAPVQMDAVPAPPQVAAKLVPKNRLLILPGLCYDVVMLFLRVSVVNGREIGNRLSDYGEVVVVWER